MTTNAKYTPAAIPGVTTEELSELRSQLVAGRDLFPLSTEACELCRKQTPVHRLEQDCCPACVAEANSVFSPALFAGVR